MTTRKLPILGSSPPTKKIQFNRAGGCEEPLFEPTRNLSALELVADVRRMLSSAYKVPEERVILGNNETSVLAHVLSNIGVCQVPVFLSSHEYAGMKMMLQGASHAELLEFVTWSGENRSEYAPRGSKAFASSISVFDPFGPIPRFPDGSIVVVSPISRISGQRLPVERISEAAIGRAIIVFDAAQCFPNMDFELASIVLGTSSKHFGAGPTVGFALLSTSLAGIPDAKLSSREALASFHAALSEFESRGQEIIGERTAKLALMKDSLGELAFQLNAAKSFVSMPASAELIGFLKARGFEVTDPADPHDTVAPFPPHLRISVTHTTKDEDIGALEANIGLFRTLEKLRNSSRKIIFVDAGKAAGSLYGSAMNYGIQILASIASDVGFRSAVFHLDTRNEADIIGQISPGDFVALSSTSPGHKRAVDFASKVRERFGASVLIMKGGIHETEVPDLQQDPRYPIDLSFLGHADISFRSFLKTAGSKEASLASLANSLESIEGITFKGRAAPSKRQFVSAGDYVLPSPENLEISAPFSLFGGGKAMMRVMSMRGCPFSCTYCAIPNRTDRLSLNTLIVHLDGALSFWKSAGTHIDSVFFEDATFTLQNAPERRLRNVGPNFALGHFARRIGELQGRHPFRFAVQTRSDTLDEATIALLAGVGLAGVYIGVESLNDAWLKRFAKGSPASKTIEIIEILHRYDVNVSASMIVTPFEEAKTFIDMERILSLGVHEVFTEYLKVFPDTPDSIAAERLGGKISQFYNIGKLNNASPNPEDNSTLIIDGKREIVEDSVFGPLSKSFYDGARSLADKFGYSYDNGHLMRKNIVRSSGYGLKISP